MYYVFKRSRICSGTPGGRVRKRQQQQNCFRFSHAHFNVEYKSRQRHRLTLTDKNQRFMLSGSAALDILKGSLQISETSSYQLMCCRRGTVSQINVLHCAEPLFVISFFLISFFLFLHNMTWIHPLFTSCCFPLKVNIIPEENRRR